MLVRNRVFIIAMSFLFAVGCAGGGGGSETAANYKITATAGANGSISPTGSVEVNYGSDQSFTIIPASSCHILDVMVDGISIGPTSTYTFTNVTRNHEIEANFDADPKITATAGANGSISPTGSVEVNYGSDQSFTITPDLNYHVLDVVIDGSSIGPTTSYTFVNVTGNHFIQAIFDTEHQYVAIGDSITAGFCDDIAADDNSQDGKNTGGGFEPILNDLLTAHEGGFPHDIVNEGVGGDKSADGLAFIPTALSLYPNAKKYLLMYGTNDSYPFLPVPSGKGLHPGDPGYPGTYKDNMQQMIDAINAAGKQVCLAKLPITLGDTVDGAQYVDPDTGTRSLLIKEYNEVIDELTNDPLNQITVTPPNFYTYFKEVDPVTGDPRYKDQFCDNLHPNGIGYQSMAALWFEALTN